MPTAFNYINKAEIASNTAVITFNSIPSTYAHLLIVGQVRSTRSTGGTDVLTGTVNNDTATNAYDTRMWEGHPARTPMYELGSYTTSGFNRYAFIPQAVSSDNWESNTFASFWTFFPNYAATMSKPSYSYFTADNNTTYAPQGIIYNIFNPTGAITRLDFKPTSTNEFPAGTKLYLYGIDD
jgi:hypothetical protein